MRWPDLRSSADFEAVPARDHHIEDHQVVGINRRLIQSVFPGRSHINGISLLPQSFGHEPRDACIVFDQQEPHESIIRQVGGKVRYSRAARRVNDERWSASAFSLSGNFPDYLAG